MARHDVVMIVGSLSDKEAVDAAEPEKICESCGVTFKRVYISAHRHARLLDTYTNRKMRDGTHVFIGVAGLLPALPGAIMAAINGRRPVLGVALTSGNIRGFDMLAQTASMPAGSTLAVTAPDKAGLINAVMFACAIVARTNPQIQEKYEQYLQRLMSDPKRQSLVDDPE